MSKYLMIPINDDLIVRLEAAGFITVEGSNIRIIGEPVSLIESGLEHERLKRGWRPMIAKKREDMKQGRAHLRGACDGIPACPRCRRDLSLAGAQ